MKSSDMLEAVRAVLRANRDSSEQAKTSGNGPFPMSFPQERLWHLRAGGSAYNLSWAFRIRGDLDVATLRESLNEMTRRHASLRTVFAHHAGRAVQYIREFQPLPLEVIDPGPLNDEEAESRLGEIIQAQASREFSLQEGPLQRAQLVRLSADHSVFLYTAHHIIFDYWSFSLFFRELGEIYTALNAGTELPPPRGHTRYADFALDQRERLGRGDSLERGLRYWQNVLREEQAVPARRDRGLARARHDLFESDFTERLRECAREQGTTLFSVLLAGWVMAVGERKEFRSGDSISVYTPAANRNRRELENIIGYFINLLVPRIDLSENPDAGRLLRRVHQAVMGAYAHQDLPVQFFNHIPGIRVPDTRIMFTFLNTPPSRLEAADLDIQEMEPGLGRAEFDLFPYMYFSRRGLECILRYDANIFSDRDAEALLTRYRASLEAILVAPTVNDATDAANETPAVSEPDSDANSEFSPEIREAAANIRRLLNEDGAPEGRPFQGDVGAYLNELIASLLGETRPDASLQSHGLNSLGALHIRNRIRSDLGVEISLADILRGINLNELHEAVIAAGNTKPESPPGDALAREKARGEEDDANHETDELSAGRKALWFLHERSPNSRAYNIAQAIHLKTPADPANLFRAATRLVERREALRTTYYFRGDEPRTGIHEFLDFERAHEDASGWSETKLAEFMEEFRGRPFDLENGPVLRMAVIDRGPTEQYVLLCLHHISLDFQSLKLLTRELHALHRSEAFGEAEPAPVRDSHEAFTRFQRGLLESETGEKQWNYWQDQLRDLPLLNLPTDFPRPPIQVFRGAGLEFEIPSDLVATAKTIAREKGLTTYTLYLSVFAVLLARYSDARDIVLGALASGRTRTEFAEAAGYFVNPLVMRLDLSGSPGVDAVLERTRNTVARALENQDLPFPILVERMAPERDLSRTPLFQVLFNLIRMHEDRENWRAIHIPQQEGQFDLTLEMHEYANDEQPNETRAILKYSTDLFRRETMERMGTHFVNLLRAMLADSRAPALRLPMLNPAEERELMARGRPEAPPREHIPAYRRFEENARENPDALALRFADEAWTYEQLNQRAEAYRLALRKRGVTDETTVAIALSRGPEMIAALLGVHKSGGAYVPLDPAYPLERIRFMARDSGAAVLIIEGDSPLLEELSRETAITILHPEDLREDMERHETEDVVDHASRLSHVIYTSGSTGLPKGTTLEQGGVSALVEWALEEYSREELVGVFASTSLCFDLSVFEILVPLCAGGCVIIAENALELAEHPAREETTLLNTVPSAAAALVRDDALPSSLRVVNLAGEPLLPDLVNRLYEHEGIRKVYDLYGPSEDTTYSTMALREKDGPTIIGRAIKGGGTYILDGEMNPVPPGVPGELYLAGRGLARGYLGRPELTKEKFISNPFQEGTRLYRTGDLALYSETGDIRFLGRADQQLKLRGYRIEPGETRAVLEQHEDVREAFVLRRGTDAFLTAYVETGHGNEHDVKNIEAKLRDFLREKLPEYMRPRFIIALAELPRLPNGKTDAANLPAPLVVRDPRQLGNPNTNMEKSVAALWREALGLQHVGPRENFFDLGGHSLLVLRIRARIKESHNIEIAVTDLFRYNTVAALARRLEELQTGRVEKNDAPGENRRRVARADLRKKRGALRN